MKKHIPHIASLLLCMLLNSRSHAQFNLLSDATNLGGGCFRLTAASSWQGGVIWNVDQLDMSRSFEVSFSMSLGCSDYGADGICFIIQNESATAIGAEGGYFCYGGVGAAAITPSVAVEFDTYYNYGTGFNDPVYDHVAIMKNGSQDHLTGNNLAGPADIFAGGGNAEDCNTHEVLITWMANKKEFNVFVDCALRVSYTGDIVENIFSGDNTLYWGFSSATGSQSNLHQVCFNYLKYLSVLSDTTACIGDTIHVDVESDFDVLLWSPDTYISDVTAEDPDIWPPVSTDYILTVTGGCSYQYIDTMHVTMNPGENIITYGVMCEGDSYTHDVTTPGATYLWYDGAVSPTHNFTIAGTYWVYVNTGICSYYDSLVLGVINLWPAIIDTTVCEGDTISIDIFHPGENYTWFDGTTASSHDFFAAGDYWVNVDVGPCSYTDTIHIAITDLFPQVIDTVICAGDIIGIDIAEPGASYVWYDGAIDADHVFSSEGTYWVDVGLSGCSYADTIYVDVIELYPQIIDTTICDGDIITIDVFDAGATYLWYDGTVSSSHDFFAEGIYWVIIQKGSCSYTDTIHVEVTPVDNIYIDTTICLGEIITIDVFEPGAIYVWYDGTVISTHNFSLAGIYWADVSIGACTHRDSITVNTVESIPLDLGNDTAYCIYETVVFDAGPGYLSYEWNDGAVTQTLIPDAPGIYYVTVVDPCGYVWVDSIEVLDIYAVPVINLEDTIQFCVNSTVDVDAGPGFSSYLWNNGSTTQTITVDGTGTYWVTISDANGCVNTDTFVVPYLYELPLVDLGVDTNVCFGEIVELDAYHFNSTYVWQDGNTNAVYQVSLPGLYSVTVENEYGCIAGDNVLVGQDCSAYIFVPNAFSPNEDGLNELFRPVLYGEVSEYEFRIWSRWGELIFDTNDVSAGWDGTILRKNAEIGTYIYFVNYVTDTDQVVSKTGTVVLLR